jgi:hypothetical protein
MKSFTKLSIALAPILGAFVSAQAAFPIGDDASVYLLGSVSSRSETNVLLANKNEQSDTAFTFTPGVQLTLGKPGISDLAADLSYRYHIITYHEMDTLNVNDNDVIANANYSSGGFQVKGKFSYLDAQTNLDLLNGYDISEYIAERVDRRILNASGYAEVEVGGKTSIGTGVSYNDQNYAENSDYTDFSSVSFPFDVYYSITPKFDLSADYVYRSVYVGGGDTTDATDQSISLGIRGKITPKLVGFLRAGYTNRDGTNSSLSDQSGATFSGDLSYAVTAKFNLGLNLIRDYSVSPIDVSSTTRTGGGLTGVLKLTNTISINARVIYYSTDYENYSRTDDYTVAGIGASYQPNQYLSISANFDSAVNDSDRNVADYDDNILQVVATVRY